ncbi:hypothetical protein SAMN04515667_1226 [Formosa sp. Hel1_31_208]|uniref:hypothetical protein n=1 Tax=Formosa sp. Hel1_31_208 TaxID=1798225 RepID=UPI00087D1379|nr:hypothetical protein [Formosa sp. Hel1_31_208]SDS02069.1 hypothetical protein SAMN04515667_1226 [Formosa sp. Hel1_31_208]
MKTLKFNVVALLMVIGLSITSCSSDDDNPGIQLPDTFISFTIDGTDYNFINIATAQSLVITLNGNNGADFLDPGDTQISLWLPIGVENGTFDVEDTFDAEYQVSFTSDPLGFDFDFADSGSMTLTQTTGEYIEGTFTATITNGDNDVITLENGAFKALTID